MNPFIVIIITIIDIYFYIIIAMVVMSWLVGFNVVNMQNDFVRQIRFALYRLTEPLLAPIRRFLPDLGGLDISPVIPMGLVVIGFSLLAVSSSVAKSGDKPD